MEAHEAKQVSDKVRQPVLKQELEKIEDQIRAAAKKGLNIVKIKGGVSYEAVKILEKKGYHYSMEIGLFSAPEYLSW